VKVKSFIWPLILALLLHFAVFTLLFVKFTRRIQPVAASHHVNIIKAVAVSQQHIEQQLMQARAEKQRQIQAAKVRKLLAQKMVANKKKKLLAQRQAKRARELKRKQAAEAKKQTAMLQAIQQKIVAEQKQTAAKTKQIQGDIDKYKALIIQAISQYWVPPPNLDQGIYCLLLVHVAPGGDVLSVDISRSSGNAALDRSAKTAVLKASPLQVPKDSDLFDNFRLIRVTVKPEGVF